MSMSRKLGILLFTTSNDVPKLFFCFPRVCYKWMMDLWCGNGKGGCGIVCYCWGKAECRIMQRFFFVAILMLEVGGSFTSVRDTTTYPHNNLNYASVKKCYSEKLHGSIKLVFCVACCVTRISEHTTQMSSRHNGCFCVETNTEHTFIASFTELSTISYKADIRYPLVDTREKYIAVS